MVSQLAKLVEAAYNTHPILAHARSWMHRNQPVLKSESTEHHCWIDEDLNEKLPMPCVFDDPSWPIEDCLIAQRLNEVGEDKTECPHYRL